MEGVSQEEKKKIYGDSVQTRMADLQKRGRATAPVVKTEIWKNMVTSFGSGFAPEKSPLLLVDIMKQRDPTANWVVTAPLTQFYREGMKRNELLGGGISALVVPKGSEKGYSMISFQNVTSLNVLGDATSEVIKLRNQFSSSMDIVREEVFRATEYTKRPAK